MASALGAPGDRQLYTLKTPITSGGLGGVVVSELTCGTTGDRFASALQLNDHFDFYPSGVCMTGESKTLVCSAVSVRLSIIIKDPVSPIEKSRASCPGGRFPPSFIHQVIIITGLNKL